MEFGEIRSKADKGIKIRAASGHFATNHSHINYYVDLTEVKSLHKMAKKAAVVLADRYRSVGFDTIICLEGTEVIGAYLAEDLSQSSLADMNSGVNLAVLAPELNSNNQMIFRDNTQQMIFGKRVLLLIASVSTGKTVGRAMDCLQYYNGQLAGICSVFSAIREWEGTPVHSVFTEDDLNGYRTYIPKECEMCAGKRKIDAIVNSYGYSSL